MKHVTDMPQQQQYLMTVCKGTHYMWGVYVHGGRIVICASCFSSSTGHAALLGCFLLGNTGASAVNAVGCLL